MTFAPAKFEIAKSNSLREKIHLQESHYLTFDLKLGVKATQMLLSILYIMWPIHLQGIMWPIYLQGLMLLHLTVKEQMHLQEIT